METINLTVLIISDNAEMTATLEELFREKNCAVISEISPHDAVKTVHLFHPSLLILDLSLPHFEQLLLCRQIRAATDATMLLLSPTQAENEIYEYYLAGINEHLTKPIPPLLLLIKSMAWLVKREWLPMRTYSIS